MKKIMKYTVLFFLLISLITPKMSVMAIEKETIQSYEVMPLATGNGLDTGSGNKVGSNCNAIFNKEAESLITDLLTAIQILGPMILILMTAFDLAQAAISQDEKALSKATSKILTRSIATICLFLVPTFVKIAFNIDGVRQVLEDSGIVNNPTCT